MPLSIQDGKRRLQEVISASMRRDDADMTSFAETPYEKNEALFLRLRRPDFLGNEKCTMLLKFQNIIYMLHLIAKYRYED